MFQQCLCTAADFSRTEPTAAAELGYCALLLLRLLHLTSNGVEPQHQVSSEQSMFTFSHLHENVQADHPSGSCMERWMDLLLPLLGVILFCPLTNTVQQ